MKFIDIGRGNVIPETRVIAIVSFDAAPIKRMVQESKDIGMVIDATCGHKCQSVIIMDSKHIVLSAHSSDELINAHKDIQNSENSSDEAVYN